MRDIVQERLIAIAYEPLDRERCLGLSRALNEFIKGLEGAHWLADKTINRPAVTLPSESLSSEAPDWTKMKMFVDRCYRYKSDDDKVLVQFCKNFMTINAARLSKSDCEEPSYDRLHNEFVQLLPFIRNILIKDVRLRDLQYEVVYRLNAKHLAPLLSSRYNKNALDYLDVFRLLRSFASDVNRDDWELDIPLKQELVYHIKNDPELKKLRLNVFVGCNAPSEWFATIDSCAFSEWIHDMDNSDARVDAFNDLLPKYEKLQWEGLRRLLTDEMFASVGGQES